jgi:hypothetical protein
MSDRRLATKWSCANWSASAPTITSSTWRRIRADIARIIRAGSRSNPQSYRWGRRRSTWYHPVSSGETGSYALTESKPSVFPQENARCFRCRGLREIGHTGGTVTFPVVTGPDDRRGYQVGFHHARPAAASLFAMYALSNHLVMLVEGYG